MNRMNPPASFATRFSEWRQRWQQHWQERSRHERWIMLSFVALVTLAVLWLWVWQPINHHLQQLTAQLPQARAQLDAAREQWRQSAGLTRQARETDATADARVAFINVVERFSAASAITALETREQQIDCTFASLSFERLVSLLDALQKDAFFYVVGATITPLEQNGAVRAEITLARPTISN